MTVIPFSTAFDDSQLLAPDAAHPETWGVWRTAIRAAFGETLTPEELETFQAVAGDRTPPQRPVRELHCVIGRRGGKSRMAALVAVFLAVFVDHRAYLSPGERGYVCVISPTIDQSRIIKRYIEGFLASSPILKQMLLKSNSADEVHLTNGVIISVNAASFRSIRGRTVLAAILDEVSFLRSEESAEPDFELMRALAPSLATTDGMIISISTPYRKMGLLYSKWAKYFGQNSPDVLVLQGSSQTWNPTIKSAFIKAAYEDDPEGAAAEYGAIWRADLSALLDSADIDAAVDYDRPTELPPQPGIQYRAFVDASAGRADAYTLCIGHMNDLGVFIADAVRRRTPPLDPNAVSDEFGQLLRTYGLREVTGDNYAGEYCRLSYERIGITYHKSPKSKSQLYLEAVAPFARRLVSIPDDKVLIRELKTLERSTSKTGRDSVDHPKHGSDDVANAVAGCCYLCTVKSQYSRGTAQFSSYTAWGDADVSENPYCGESSRWDPDFADDQDNPYSDYPEPQWMTQDKSYCSTFSGLDYLKKRT